MKTILLYIFLCLASIAGCGLLGNDEPDIPGKIVFSANDDNGTSQIFTMNADGTNLKQLTFWDNSSVQPAWSPDGRRIAFSTYYRATTLGPSLYIMDADGDNKRPLKKLPYESPNALYGSAPDWSPDGKKIAYEFCTNCEAFGSNYEIAVVEVEGEEYDSTQIDVITKYRGSDTYPTWSPDGSRIVFRSDRSSDNHATDLFIIDTSGSNISRLTKTGNVSLYAWNKSNNTITFRPYGISSKLKQVYIENRNVETFSIEEVEGILLFPNTWSLKGTLLLATQRELNHPRENSLLIMNLNKKRAIKIYSQVTYEETNPSIHGADWYIGKNKNRDRRVWRQ